MTDPAAATALAGATLAAHLDRIAEQGYTVVPGAIEPDLVDELVEVLSRLEHDLDVKPARNRFEGTSTIRIYNLLAHHPVFARVPVHPTCCRWSRACWTPAAWCRRCRRSPSTRASGPSRSTPTTSSCRSPSPTWPPCATRCGPSPTFTEANGATRLVPGSHLADASPDLMAHHDTIPAEMEKGSVLVWHGSLWHGGGANTTSHRRIGLAMNYCAGWVRQQENQQVGIPLATLRTFEPRLRELCGFGVYHGLIGHIDRRDPADVVLGPHPPAADPTAEPDPTAPTRMVWDGA
ncbi:MAG: phytanoyl-CoA dioxygenase family protein [Acidimicrobiales bacterium]